MKGKVSDRALQLPVKRLMRHNGAATHRAFAQSMKKPSRSFSHIPSYTSTNKKDNVNTIASLERMIDGPSSCSSNSLWEDNKHLFYASLLNPFIRDLAEGSLPREVFDEYLSQDVYYLGVFEEALSTMHDLIQLEIGVHGVHREEAKQRALALLQSVQKEISLVQGSFLSIEENNTAITWATESYTDFLRKVQTDPKSSVAEILASLLPCFRLYAEIARHLDETVLSSDESHLYSHWIKEYASPKFWANVQSAEWIFDMAASRDARVTAQCQDHYTTAMKKELQFFGSHALAKSDSDRHEYGLLVVDFDETCTQGDTISKIIAASLESSNIDENEKQSRKKTYEQLVANYISSRQDTLDALVPEGLDNSPVQGTQWLEHFIQELHVFDTRMNQVVVDAGILSGITWSSLKSSSQTIQIQHNCIDTLRLAMDNGMHVAILSVNWSAHMIQNVFKRFGFAVNVLQDISEIDLDDQTKIHIIANQLEFENDRSTGTILSVCESSLDKKNILHNITSQNTKFSKCIYIGDSITDIGPLTEASLGIIMGQSATLMNAVRIAGMNVSPLEEEPCKKANKTLYHSDSWEKVYGLISGVTWCPKREEKNRLLGQIPRVLLISGSDSGGGAGLQADIKTCVSCGTFPTNAVSAVTVQNSHGVDHIHTIPGRVLTDQIHAVQSDIGSSCIKIGMLGSIENVKAVSEYLKRERHCPPIILDPVLVSSSGSALAEQGLVNALKEDLFSLATMITPNISEASQLLDGMQIDSIDAMKVAAKRLHELGPRYVLVKGGHYMDSNAHATDVMYDGYQHIEFSKVFLDATNNHGTGCALASAIASYIARGETVTDAVSHAKEFVWRAMERSRGINLGYGEQRPMNLAHHVDNWIEPAHRIANDVDVSLYAVSSPHTTSQDKTDEEILDAIRAVVKGGASVIQIRDKVSEGLHLTRIVSKIARFCRPRGVKVIVNDRVDVCIAADACGVHVGQGDIPAAAVRRMIGPDKILGVSCKTIELALKAQHDGADYVGCGAVFDTPTKKTSRRIGVEGVKKIREKVSIPVVAIGGLDASNVEQVILESTCHGVAVVRAIFDAQDIQSATKHLRTLVDKALLA